MRMTAIVFACALSLSTGATAKAIRSNGGGASFAKRFPETNAAASGVAPVVLPLFSLLAPSSTDQSVTADLCDTYSSSMTGNYFCLRGDGTGTGATLTATGTPTTETRSYCGNGTSCGNTTGKRLNGTGDYYSTAAQASPAGSFTICSTFSINSATAVGWLSTKMTVASTARWYVSSGQLAVDVYKASGTGTSALSAAGAVTARARHFGCLRYTYVADGSSLLKQFIDGVATGTTSTVAVGPPAPASSAWATGANLGTGTFSFPGVIFNSFFTETALADADILAMSNTALGKLTPATGQALTFTRTTTKRCANTAGSEITVLPASRPCVTQGGVSIEPAATNVLLRSEELDSATWTKVSAGTTVTANNAVAPDWSSTADTVVFDPVNATQARAEQTLSGLVASTTYTISGWARVPSGTGTLCFGYNNSLAADTGAKQTVSLTSTWQRFAQTYTTAAATTTTNVIIGGSPDTATCSSTTTGVQLWGWQHETGAFATSYVATTSAAVTRTAETMTAPNPLIASPATWCLGATTAPNGVWGADAASRYFISLGGTTVANSSFMSIQSSRTPTLSVNDSSNLNRQRSDTAITADSTTRRVVGSSASGTLNLYLDSVLVGTVSGTGTGIITTQPATAQLGHLAGGSQLNGLLSSVRIDSTASGCN